MWYLINTIPVDLILMCLRQSPGLSPESITFSASPSLVSHSKNQSVSFTVKTKINPIVLYSPKHRYDGNNIKNHISLAPIKKYYVINDPKNLIIRYENQGSK